MLDRLPLPPQLDRVILVGGTLAAIVATPIALVLGALLLFDEITAPEMIFWFAFAGIVAGALGTVLLPNIVHAALSLVVTLLGIAAIFLLLGSEFLALAQVLIYGGGVTILLIFGLMMTNATDQPIVTDGTQKPFAFGVAALIGGLFAAAMFDANWGDAAPVAIGMGAFGTRLFEDFALPFIIVAVLLDVALSGALIIARADAPEEQSDADESSEAAS
jgi:NADH:ubiquinone oxidoreductase subunit 6 (subunit J)